MRYQSFRRGSIGSRGREIEQAVASVDPYLYVDIAWDKPRQEQLWRKHPEAHLPMLIFDIPKHASISAVLKKLTEMDHGGVDLVASWEKQSKEAKYRAEIRRFERNKAMVTEVARYVNKHI